MESILRVPNPDVIHEQLTKMLSDSPFTVNSLYGLLILGIVVFLVIKLFHNIGKCIRFVLSFLILWELMHVIVTRTELGAWIPFLGNLFKFDVLTAFAQMCVGTPVATGLLWLQTYLNTVVGGAFSTIIHAIVVFFRWLDASLHV